MLAELPFVTAEEIVAQYRPGRMTKMKSVLETLRGKGLLSLGISQPLRDAHGRTRGSMRLYPSLVRDAAALAAAGREDQARRLIRIAEQLEARQDTRRLAGVLIGVYGSLPEHERSVDMMFRHAGGQPAMLIEITRYTSAVERATKDSPRAGTVAFGRVRSLDQTQALLDVVRGPSFPVPRSALPAETTLGSAVAIRWADLGRGVWMTTELALELPGGDDAVYPYERGPDEDPVIVPAAVLNGAPTVRRSRRTTVID